jgi:hypothetical protein
VAVAEVFQELEMEIHKDLLEVLVAVLALEFKV